MKRERNSSLSFSLGKKGRGRRDDFLLQAIREKGSGKERKEMFFSFLSFYF